MLNTYVQLRHKHILPVWWWCLTMKMAMTKSLRRKGSLNKGGGGGGKRVYVGGTGWLIYILFYLNVCTFILHVLLISAFFCTYTHIHFDCYMIIVYKVYYDLFIYFYVYTLFYCEHVCCIYLQIYINTQYWI